MNLKYSSGTNKTKFLNYLGLYFQKKIQMAKPCTFPTLYDEALQIHISKLKGWGYLDPEQIKSGTLNGAGTETPQAVF
jgi:hypothetical protein